MTAAGGMRSPLRGERRAVPALGVVALLVGLAAPAPAAAQSSDPPSLEAAEAAADSGAVDRARKLLDGWLEAGGEDASPERRDRARFLEARLTEDPDSARRLYARLAVEGGSEIGARARLRLAQLRLARGETEAALGDLELVRADFPGSPVAAESWIWTGRVHRAAGTPEEACRAFGRAERAAARTGDAGARRRAREARSSCGAGAEDVAERDADASPAAWVVQLGAFRDAEAAERLRRRAEEAGFQARVAGGNAGLRRVRVGRFGDRDAAESVMRRLRDRGFRDVIVERVGADDGP